MSMEYEVIKELKKSNKSMVNLVREKGTEQYYIQKILKGRQEVYKVLLNGPHPFLP